MALNTTLLKRLAALGCACALSLGASACGSKQASTTSSPTASTSLTHMDGITATGNLGEQPTVSFDSLPYTVHNNSYAILQTGDGDTVQDGQRICLQNMFVNTDDGSVLSSSWGSDPVDCATITQSQTPSDYYGLLVGQKVHTTIAIGYNLDETSSSSASNSAATATNSAQRLADASAASTGLSSLAALNDFRIDEVGGLLYGRGVLREALQSYPVGGVGCERVGERGEKGFVARLPVAELDGGLVVALAAGKGQRAGGDEQGRGQQCAQALPPCVQAGSHRVFLGFLHSFV